MDIFSKYEIPWWSTSFDNGEEIAVSNAVKNKNISQGEITKDFEKIIQYGLHENNKPSTLISPRPRIKVKRFRTYFEKEHKVIETEKNDDSMNIVISKINFEEIYKAMFDKSILFEFDLT